MWYVNWVLVFAIIQVMSLCIKDVDAKIEPHMWCGACIAMVEDMKIQISTVDRKKKVQVGSYRLEADGTQKIKEVPYSTSDLFLMDELERICNAMHHYGEKTDSKGEKIIIRTSSYDGTSISMKGVRRDDQLTRILMYACETIIEEHEDAMLKILKTYHNERSEVEKEICVKHAKICTDDEVKARMWAMAQAVMAGIQEKADERLNQSELEAGEELPKEAESYEEAGEDIAHKIVPEGQGDPEAATLKEEL